MAPVKGTRNLIGADARAVLDAIARLRWLVEQKGFQPYIPSSLAYRSLFDGQVGDNRMFEFKDRADRNLVLVPEITAQAREDYRDGLEDLSFPSDVWYAQRCYRYDNPQRGRYREFFQFGVEQFGVADSIKRIHLFDLAMKCLKTFGLTEKDFTWTVGVDRGMGYYNGQGFEFRSNDGLQLVGGGPYEEGIGFALGIERCLLVAEEKRQKEAI